LKPLTVLSDPGRSGIHSTKEKGKTAEKEAEVGDRKKDRKVGERRGKVLLPSPTERFSSLGARKGI